MNAAVKAGVTYFGAVLLVGFALGIMRVLLLLPRLGETASVSLETPFMLVVSWMASRWTVKKFSVADDVPARVLMGGAAFVLLMIAELVLAVFVFGRPLRDHFAAYASLPGAVGLAAQIAFAAFPLLQRMQQRNRILA